MSHHSVLPDNIKGTHSKKSLGQETLLIFTSLCLQSYPADASATPLPTLSPPARYWHCSSAHVLRVCLVPRGDHRSFHLSSFSLVSVTLVVCFIAALCVTLCWHAAGILWGSAQCTKDTVPGYGKVTQAWCKDRCEFDVCVRCARAKARASRRPHAHAHARARQRVHVFLCSDTRPSKENRHSLPHEDSTAAGRRQSLLVCATMLSSPVSCQNRKREGRKWRLGKCRLDVCWLEVQLCLTVTLPARKNRPVLGVTHSGVLQCYFYHFRKAGMLFPAVDTGLGHFCLSNSAAQERGRRPIWLCPFGY